jgi:hypothetical protein
MESRVASFSHRKDPQQRQGGNQQSGQWLARFHVEAVLEWMVIESRREWDQKTFMDVATTRT